MDQRKQAEIHSSNTCTQPLPTNTDLLLKEL
jgi:hypothetical protein